MNATMQLNEGTRNAHKIPLAPKWASPLLWLLFLVSVGLLVYQQIFHPDWNIYPIFRMNGFTLLIWTTVTFFSAVVSSYAKNYLNGFKYHQKFTLLSFGFTLTVMVLVMANHIIPFLLSWLLMGLLMARLIGVNSDWNEAKESSKLAQKYFVIGSVFLGIGVLLLVGYSGEYTISGLAKSIDKTPPFMVTIAALCIIIAAMIQSAMYPFHRWLLSAMTAPTPASALMHAGFVNGAGILLTILAVVLTTSNTLTLIFIIGGITAIVAQFTKLLQVNVKQKLACSTIAQMGFMIMQCGLGFFNAAIAHLILHGFYKAYLFLSSGEEIAQAAPKKATKIKIKPFQALLVLVFSLVGALLFALLTGKTNVTVSSVFLTLIVAITVGQMTYNIVKEKSLSITQKLIAPIVLFIAGIGIYALLFKGISVLMSDMPLAEIPQPLSVLHIVFGVAFHIGFFIMKLGLYKKIPWLYVKLLNLSQPFEKTIRTSKI